MIVIILPFFVLHNIDSFNIKLDNVDNLEDRPLKRPKFSELMDSEFDKDVNKNFPSPPSPI